MEKCCPLYLFCKIHSAVHLSKDAEKSWKRFTCLAKFNCFCNVLKLRTLFFFFHLILINTRELGWEMTLQKIPRNVAIEAVSVALFYSTKAVESVKGERVRNWGPHQAPWLLLSGIPGLTRCENKSWCFPAILTSGGNQSSVINQLSKTAWTPRSERVHLPELTTVCAGLWLHSKCIADSFYLFLSCQFSKEIHFLQMTWLNWKQFFFFFSNLLPSALYLFLPQTHVWD